MVYQVFMSHTKLDREFCDEFDSVAARVGLKVFRSEFEKIEPPAWKTIKAQMNKSSAMFLLVGKELVKAQESSELDKESREKWKFTQNWIAYETGLACQRKMDVWVVCDNVRINFPVPYLNHYEIYGINREDEKSIDFYKNIFKAYSFGVKLPIDKKLACTCPYCKAIFSLHSRPLRQKVQGSEHLPNLIPCPTCLQDMFFP